MVGAGGGADDNAAQANHIITQSTDGPYIGFSHTQGLDPQCSTEVFPTLRAEGGGHAVMHGFAPLAFSAGNSAKAYGVAVSEDLVPPLRASASGTNQVPTVVYIDEDIDE
jgi:hypothetical protein